MITLPACGDIPFALRLTVLDGLDGVMNNDLPQVGAAGKGVDANLLQTLGNVDRLQGVEILECVVLEPTATWSWVIFTPLVTSTPFLKNFTP